MESLATDLIERAENARSTLDLTISPTRKDVPMKNHRTKLQFPAGLDSFTDVNQNHWHADAARCVTLPPDTDLACFIKAGFASTPPRNVTMRAPFGMADVFQDSKGEDFPIDPDGNITLDLDQHTLHDALHAGFIVVP